MYGHSGRSKAVAAINVLVAHLADLGGTTGSSEWHFPAVQALHKIGTPAIPDVSKALGGDTNPTIRMYAAQALGAIGGKSAQDKLEQALQKE